MSSQPGSFIVRREDLFDISDILSDVPNLSSSWDRIAEQLVANRHLTDLQTENVFSNKVHKTLQFWLQGTGKNANFGKIMEIMKKFKLVEAYDALEDYCEKRTSTSTTGGSHSQDQSSSSNSRVESNSSKITAGDLKLEKLIQKNLEVLRKRTCNLSSLLAILYSEDIISRDEMSLVDNKMVYATEYQQNGKLWSILENKSAVLNTAKLKEILIKSENKPLVLEIWGEI